MLARGERIVTVLAGALFLFGAVVALVDPKEPFTAYRQPVVIGATVVLVLVGLLARAPATVRRCCAWVWAGPSVAVFAGLVALATGLSMRLAYSWDVRIVLDVAGRLHAGVPLTRYEQGYATRYPNNTAMVALERLAYDVAGSTGWPVVVILLTVAAVGVAVTVWAVHRMVLPIGGPVRAVVAQLVTIVLVAASPWLAIPYTDVFALPLLSGALLLAMTAMRRRHDAWALLLALAAGSSLALAAMLKTIPYVVAGALLLTGVLAALAAADRRAAARWLAGTLVAVVAVGVVALGATSARSAVLADQTRPSQTSAPLLWWLANGMTKTESPGHPPRYGGFNAAMGKAIAGMTSAQATQWSQDWIRSQWAERGPWGTARFYAAKAAWNWGDGMFWAWGEGQDARPDRLPPGSGFVGVVRAVDRPDGRWYQLRSDLAQAVWLALLVVAGLGAVLTPRPRPEVVLLALSVLGLAAFTLLFQGRSRYLFTFVPVVVSLAAMVHPAVTGWRDRGARAWDRRFSRSSRGGPAPG